MFLITTYVTISHINGVGVYTKNKISPGTVVAQWTPEVDRTFDNDVFDKLPKVVQQYIRKHGTKSEDGRWKLGMDGDQYINHSDRPNLTRRGDKLITEHTINAGTELTCDYRPYRNDI
jgi:uncharacterized protein